MVDVELRFDGQVAVVTGAGSGIGRSYALELAARGAAVVCNDIAASAADSTVAEIERSGGRAVAETSSVASPQGGEAIVAAAMDAFGSIDILINNAGQIRNASFDEMTIEDFDDVVRTHLAGSFYVTQPAYRRMKTSGYGRIIFTSSDAGLFGLEWSANYAAAKAGLAGLSKVVAIEGAPFGITANVVLPMAMGTSLDSGRPPYSPTGLEDIFNAISPVAAYMTVENVAPFVVFLVSRACEFSGRIFSIGCGRVAEAFITMGQGWFAPDPSRSTPEEIAAHLDEVCNFDGTVTLDSALDQFRTIAARISH